MIDHISIPVNDLLIARSFYSASLAPLGYIEMHNESDCVGFGKNDRIFLWLFEWVGFNSPIHIAFSAADIEEVNRFYEWAWLMVEKEMENQAIGNNIAQITMPHMYLIWMAITLKLSAEQRV